MYVIRVPVHCRQHQLESLNVSQPARAAAPPTNA